MKWKHNGLETGMMDLNGLKVPIKGGEFEIPDDHADDALIERLKDAGHEPIAAKTWELSIDGLTKVDGIGESYAEKILDHYETGEDLIEAGAEEVADEVDGVSVEKAKDIIESLK